MADRDSAPPGNGTSWNSITAGFESWRSREAESSTATAATTQRYPCTRVSPREVESDQANLSGLIAAMRQGPEALEALYAQQVANFRYRTTPYRLASSNLENPDYINRQNERRARPYNERLPDFFVDDEIDVESGSTLTAETPNATPTAAKYLSELQPIAVNDLPEADRMCAICKEPYNTDEDPEQACKVGHCGHILGRTCLSTWVMPAGSRPNTTCPLCRVVLFEDEFLLDAIPSIGPARRRR